MVITRRTLLRRIGAGAVVGVGIPFLSGFSHAEGGQLPDLRHAGGPVLLNRNENAYGPSEKVLAAMREALSLTHRFPQQDFYVLRGEIANRHAVKPDQVVLGCGSSEILRMAASTFLGRGKKLVLAAPTFDVITYYARGAGAQVVAVPLNKRFAHDLGAMANRTDASTSLVYICNPNNPTGTLTPRRDLELFIRKLPATAHVVVDEAYHHYVGGTSAYASFIDHPIDDSRVIVTRTFSKIHGLAGIRIGYAIAASQVARRISSYRLLDGVNVVAASAALAALQDAEHLRASAQRNTDDREEFFNQVSARMLRTIDSHTNFVMLNAGHPAEEIVEHFKKNNILLPRPVESMSNYVRVSLGTAEEMLEFWRVWDLLPPSKMSM
jgi:histidinol-phosphate aminotransferase